MPGSEARVEGGGVNGPAGKTIAFQAGMRYHAVGIGRPRGGPGMASGSCGGVRAPEGRFSKVAIRPFSNGLLWEG